MNSYLETLMAVILVIIVFSIVTYVIQELIAANLEYRGKMLHQSIKQILDGANAIPVLTVQFFNHPQIKMLMEDLQKLPSYIPAANFALALSDIVAKKSTAVHNDLFQNFKSGIAAFAETNGDLAVLLKNWSDNAESLKELQANIEQWYDDYMDRVSGWYKRKSRVVTRWIAIGVTLVFNFNIIAVTKTINSDTILKAKLVATAETLAENEKQVKDHYLGSIDSTLAKIPQKSQASIDSVLRNYNIDRMNSMKTLLKDTHVTELPIGWNKMNFFELAHLSFTEWLLMLFGWFIGAVTISMGAPFWFDLLLRIVNIRKAGNKPASKSTE